MRPKGLEAASREGSEWTPVWANDYRKRVNPLIVRGYALSMLIDRMSPRGYPQRGFADWTKATCQKHQTTSTWLWGIPTSMIPLKGFMY